MAPATSTGRRQPPYTPIMVMGGHDLYVLLFSPHDRIAARRHASTTAAAVARDKWVEAAGGGADCSLATPRR